jgi:hypothetical protein
VTCKNRPNGYVCFDCERNSSDRALELHVAAVGRDGYSRQRTLELLTAQEKSVAAVGGEAP